MKNKMNGWIKGLIIFWIAIIIFFCGTMIYFIWGEGANKLKTRFTDTYSTEIVKETTYLPDDVSVLNIDFRSDRVSVHNNINDEIKIIQYGSKNMEEKEKYHENMDNDILNIFKEKSMMSFAFFSFTPKTHFEIYLPTSWKGTLNVATNSGTINIKEKINLDSVTLNSSSGSIKVADGIECTAIEMRTSSGSIKAENITAEGDIDIQSSSGSIKAENLITSGHISIQSSSGSIISENILDAENIKIVTSSGSAKINIVQGLQVMIKTNSGSINLNELYSISYDVESSSCRVNIGNSKGGGKVMTKSGSIRFGISELSKELDVAASSGSVQLNIDENVSFDLKTSSNSGSIKSKFPLEYSNNGKYGDEPYVKLNVSTSSGSIRINKL